MRETHEVRWHGRCRNDDIFTFSILHSQRPNSFFVTTAPFESHRNILFRHPQSLSLPTTTQAGETCRFAAVLAHDNCRDTRTLRRTVEIATVQLIKRIAPNPACL